MSLAAGGLWHQGLVRDEPTEQLILSILVQDKRAVELLLLEHLIDSLRSKVNSTKGHASFELMSNLVIPVHGLLILVLNAASTSHLLPLLLLSSV